MRRSDDVGRRACTPTTDPAEDLIRDAAAAMHRAKERDGARYELFDQGLRGRAMYRLRVENSLRRALERQEFVLEYQPVVSLPDGRLIGVESLIRWDDPERGRIAPAEFVPVAEENGLIEPIGRWVLDHACRQAAQWQRQRPDAPPVQVSVNLSAAQLASSALIDTVRSALRGSGATSPRASSSHARCPRASSRGCSPAVPGGPCSALRSTRAPLTLH